MHDTVALHVEHAMCWICAAAVALKSWACVAGNTNSPGKLKGAVAKMSDVTAILCRSHILASSATVLAGTSCR